MCPQWKKQAQYVTRENGYFQSVLSNTVKMGGINKKRTEEESVLVFGLLDVF